MGMAAGQARLLSITSRLSDNELRAQLINNDKMRLATQSSQVSEAYVTALNNAQMMFTNYDANNNQTYQQLTFNALTAYNPYNNQYALSNASGNVLLSETDAANYEKAKANSNPLETFLACYGLEYSSSYFETTLGAYIDGDDTVILPSAGTEIDTGFKPEQLKNMYYGATGYDGYENTLQSESYWTYVTNLDNYTTAYEDLLGLSKGICEVFLNNSQRLNNVKESYNSTNNIAQLLSYPVNNGDTNVYSSALYTQLQNIHNIATTSGKTTIKSYMSILENLNNYISNVDLDSPSYDASYEASTGKSRITIYEQDDEGNNTPVYQIIKKSDGTYWFKEHGYVDASGKTTWYDAMQLTGWNKEKEDKDNAVSNNDATYGHDTHLYQIYQYDASGGSTSTTYGSQTIFTTSVNKIEFDREKIDAIFNQLGKKTKEDGTEEIISNLPGNKNTDDNGNLTDIGIIRAGSLSSEYLKATLDSVVDAVYANITSIIDFNSGWFTNWLAGSGASATNVNEFNSKKFTVMQYVQTLNSITGNTSSDIDAYYGDSAVTTYLTKYNKGDFNGKPFKPIFEALLLDSLFDYYGEPTSAWVDKKDGNENGDAKAKWYENLFNRIEDGGYKTLKNGLASSTEWIQFAFESGIVTLEQVDDKYTWNKMIYSNCSDITEQTNDAAVAKAEAEYNAAMSKIENKDKRYDMELKNIDTEHNSLQVEYDSIKGAIDKNIERTFKIYS